MSLINDMLRDLDMRRVHSVTGNLAALPVADSATGGLRHRIGWLLPGLAMALPIAIAVPLLTDYLDVFDWDQPGGPIVITKIKLPEAVKHRRAPRPAQREMHNSVRAQPDIPAAPGMPASTTGMQARTITTDEAPAEPGQARPTSQTNGDIVIRRHGAMQAYRLAADMAASGDTQAAVTRLQEILAREDDHHEARLLLARLHAQQLQHDHAGALLQDGLARYPLHAPYAHLLARLLLTAGRYEEAIAHLEAALPGASRDADHHGLLAGLYRQTDRPASAVKHYTIALALSPDRGEWWMGLGMVQEQVGDHGRAYTAFNRAMEFPLETALRDYIVKRLQKLSRYAPADVTDIRPTGKT